MKNLRSSDSMKEGGLELTAEPFTTFPEQTSHANCVRTVTDCVAILSAKQIKR